MDTNTGQKLNGPSLKFFEIKFEFEILLKQFTQIRFLTPIIWLKAKQLFTFLTQFSLQKIILQK